MNPSRRIGPEIMMRAIAQREIFDHCRPLLIGDSRVTKMLIKKELILEAIKATDEAVKTFGIGAPKIAVAGLNPHAGEGGI